ncbi:unnamed protein product [Mytilus edulis]|uniref:Uncharacterized protein n=1 Tax=Mytilus edulis TaxID=6550 RepID=A0A8S3QC07_MYTED|nr:unnamed protein product [Mytilus edulis]
MSHNEDIEYTENLSVHRNQPHHENQEHYDDSDTTHVPFIADDRLQRSVQKEDVTDKGYAWFILIISCIVYIIVPGSVKSFGVLYTELLDYYDGGAGNTAGIPGVLLFLYFGLAPVSNYLGEKYTYRVVIGIGSCLVLIGQTASAFVPKLEFLYITYGIITGMGYGLIFGPCSTILSFYFDKKRGLATGIMASCSGIGNMCFPYMYKYLIENYGLPGTILIAGAVYFHVCPVSMFLRQPIYVTRQIVERQARQKETQKCGALKRIFRFDLFKNSKFSVYITAICLQAANTTSNKVILPGYIRGLGFGIETITLAVSLFGASELVGRILLGWFADKNVVSRITIFMICSFICAITAFCMPYLPYKPAVIAYAVVIGAFSGSIWGLNQVIIIDCVGLKHLSPAFGLLEDATGSWTSSFYFVGILSALAVVLCLLERPISHIWCCHRIVADDIIDVSRDIVDKSIPVAYKFNG